VGTEGTRPMNLILSISINFIKDKAQIITLTVIVTMADCLKFFPFGGVIGAVITWWVYNRQEKTSYMQEKLLEQIVTLEKKILSLEEKIESMLKKRK
jgi:hypothetical protein